MPQTILAVLGLMITITFSLSTQRKTVQTQREMIRNELEVMATGVALEAMERIRTRAFDQAVASDPDEVHSTFDFAHPFSTGRHCAVFDGTYDCNDLDDFHAMKTATVDFEMDEETSMPFEVDVQVRYVEPDLTPAAGATFWKEVTVYVQDAPQGDAPPFIREPIYLARVFAYNFGANDQGHGGTSQGHDHGEDQEWFEDFIEWFGEKIEDFWFRFFAAIAAHGEGYTELGNAISNQDTAAITDALNADPEAAVFVRDYWYDQREAAQGD